MVVYACIPEIGRRITVQGWPMQIPCDSIRKILKQKGLGVWLKRPCIQTPKLSKNELLIKKRCWFFLMF
jgi:hypothetical protein